MSWLKPATVGICLVLSALAAGVASDAVGKPLPLILKVNKVVAPVGAPIDAEAEIEYAGRHCVVGRDGTLTVNGKPKDKEAVTGKEFSYCELGAKFSLAGAIREMELTSSEQITVLAKPKLTVEEAEGPCVYEAGTVLGKLQPIPGESWGYVIATFKRNSHRSSATCPATASFYVAMVLRTFVNEELGYGDFETET